MDNYKDSSIQKINSSPNNEGKSIEEGQNEFKQILYQLSQLYHNPDDLYQNINKLYDFNPTFDDTTELCMIDLLTQSNIINILFLNVQSNPQFCKPFLEFVLWLSEIEHSETALKPDLLDFLISLINPNINISIITYVADILANFSKPNAKIASKITEKKAIHYFLEILNIRSKEQMDEDHQKFIISILSFFGDMLDFENFTPIDYFKPMIQAGLYFLDFPDDEILYHSLILLCNASDTIFNYLFIPLISKQLDAVHKILKQVDNEDRELSQLAFDFLLNVTEQFNKETMFQLFSQCQEDLMLHLQNSIQLNKDNLINTLKLIGNMIESPKKTKDDSQSNPIFCYFNEFLIYNLPKLVDFDLLETKTIMAQIFSKMTYLCTNEEKLKFVENTKFIQTIFSLFNISSEIDYDLLVALNNLLDCASLNGETTIQHLCNSISEIITIDELENLFIQSEENDLNLLNKYQFMRNQVVKKMEKALNTPK